MARHHGLEIKNKNNPKFFLPPANTTTIIFLQNHFPKNQAQGRLSRIRIVYVVYIVSIFCYSVFLIFFPTVGWVVGTSNISEKQVPRGGNMIRGRLNVFLYFHTMYLQNCTLHIPIVLTHHVPAEEQRSYSFTLQTAVHILGRDLGPFNF